MKSLYSTFEDLISESSAKDPLRVAVVAADDEMILKSIAEARTRNLIDPTLIGDRRRIASQLDTLDCDLEGATVIDAREDESAARLGAALLRDGKVECVMKGGLHTDVFMKALLDKDADLRMPARRVSHVFVADIPAYPRLLAVTDAAVNIRPDLAAKSQILQNAIDLMRSIGLDRPKAAILSAVETVNPLIESTTDAAALTLMARRGQITDAEVDGPLAFDNAVSTRAAEVKGISSEVAGAADIVVVPDLVSGNILAKNLDYLADATLAGLVVGLRAPVILSSRAEPVEARLASFALARLAARAGALTSEKMPARAISDELDGCCAPMPEETCFPRSAAS